MNKKKRLFLTTPIYYASGNPHLGHAYTTVLGDVIAKYFRKINYDVFFLSGMDEHGQKISEKAKEKNMEEQAFVDSINKEFLALWKLLKIDLSNFIRTSSKEHENNVKICTQKLLDDKQIYLDFWEGLYCVGCEENYSLSDAVKHENGDLYCKIGHKLTTKKEESYFLKISRYQEWLEEFLINHKDFISPYSRYTELKNNFLDKKITDLSVTRINLPWGILMPGNDKHTMYVWIDALLSYLSGLGMNTKNDQDFKNFWLNEDTRVIHLMSKEIVRFHCIYWPILLKMLDLRLPTNILSHGWIITKEGKMSKSLGNVIDPIAYANEFGSDALRHFFISQIDLTQDSVFARDLFINVYNNDLANNYGNLVSRTIGVIKKYNNGIVSKANKKMNEHDLELKQAIENLVKNVPVWIEKIQTQTLVKEIFNLGKMANKFFELKKPWELKKANQIDELNNFMFLIANVTRVMTSLLEPILTEGTKLACKQMNFNDQLIDFNQLTNLDLINDHQIADAVPIYLRVEEK